MKKPESKQRSLSRGRKHRAMIKARRPVHKKILLHPMAIFLLLCTGVLLVSWTWQAAAADYAVKAKVPAAPITQPAVITSPTDGSHFKTKPITVTGTCKYQSYINLYRNGLFSGSALCLADGSFSLQTDLALGANILQARIFNITDDEGPLGPGITVYYDLQSAPTASSTNSTFNLQSVYKYMGYPVNEAISWQVSVSGGTPPYAFNVKWGDGTESNYVLDGQSALDMRHTYNQSGNYVLKVYGTDLKGSQAFLQLVAVVLKDKNALIAAPVQNLGPPLNPPRNSLVWLWPAYAFLLAMALSFWLGERQEYYALMRKTRRGH